MEVFSAAAVLPIRPVRPTVRPRAPAARHAIAVKASAAQPAATDRKVLLGSLAASVLMSGALAVSPPALAVSPPALALTADYAGAWSAHHTATIAAAYPELLKGLPDSTIVVKTVPETLAETHVVRTDSYELDTPGLLGITSALVIAGVAGWYNTANAEERTTMEKKMKEPPAPKAPPPTFATKLNIPQQPDMWDPDTGEALVPKAAPAPEKAAPAPEKAVAAPAPVKEAAAVSVAEGSVDDIAARAMDAQAWIIKWRMKSGPQSSTKEQYGFFASLQKALFGSFAAALLSTICVHPASAESAYPELFQGKEAIIEAQGKSTSMSVGLSSTSPLVLGAAVGVVGVTALTMQSMSNSGAGQGGATSAAVEAKAPEPEAFSAEAAAARSAEAQLWVERFRTRTEVAKRAAEAEAWISSFRFTTAMREREQRVAERAAWIAAWRSMSSGSGAVAEEAAKSPLCKWFVGLVEGMVFLNGGGLNGQEDKKANPNDMRGVMRKLDV